MTNPLQRPRKRHDAADGAQNLSAFWSAYVSGLWTDRHAYRGAVCNDQVPAGATSTAPHHHPSSPGGSVETIRDYTPPRLYGKLRILPGGRHEGVDRCIPPSGTRWDSRRARPLLDMEERHSSGRLRRQGIHQVEPCLQSIPPAKPEAWNVNRSKRIVWEPPAAAVNRTSASDPSGDPRTPVVGCTRGSLSRPVPPWTRSIREPRSVVL
jgi:hypothetical protein